MNRVADLDRRYAMSAALAKYGVEVVVVGDPVGARLDALARDLIRTAEDGGGQYLEDLAASVRALRWRRLAQRSA